MTFRGLDKGKFGWMLSVGTEDSELRRFFNDCRSPLITSGAKVQNPPSGKVARVKMLAQGLPSKTDAILQRWFFKNLEMSDPEPVSTLIEMLRMYEDANEVLPDDVARRYARSCLVHLVCENPPEELLSFMRPKSTEIVEPPLVEVIPHVDAPSPQQVPLDTESLAKALISLADGQDPDAFLEKLPPTVATTIACTYAIRSGLNDEVANAMSALSNEPGVQAVFSAAMKRREVADLSKANNGLQVSRLARPDEPCQFDQKEDEIFGICTKDFPESAVFIRPYALRKSNGAIISLSNEEDRVRLFPDNGDVMAFVGIKYPRQPKKWEMGFWKVQENPTHKPNRSNFHLDSDRTAVYEVVRVNFSSLQYDSVREYIKHSINASEHVAVKERLLLLSDGLIIGHPLGKDLSRNEGFDAGLPAWRSLQAFEFEGQILVPGPLPPSEIYECEPLSMSIRKLAPSLRNAANRPTHAQLKQLQDAIATGDVRLNAARAARLTEELRFIDQHEGAVEAIIDQLRQEPSVSERIEHIVQSEAAAQILKKDALLKEISKLEQSRTELREKIAAAGKEQRAIAPTVTKAIRAAFETAQADGPKTLAQATVLKVLMESVSPSNSELLHRTDESLNAPLLRGQPIDASGNPFQVTLRKLGVGAKAAEALVIVGQVAANAGLILAVEGIASRVAVGSWASSFAVSMVYDCPIGLIDDAQIRNLGSAVWRSFCILDANLSPIDLYARPMLDYVQRRISMDADPGSFSVFMSLSDGVAALPLSKTVRAVSLKVSLDVWPDFLSIEEAELRLTEIADRSVDVCWSNELWRPALSQVIRVLQGLQPEERALAISYLDASALKFPPVP